MIVIDTSALVAIALDEPLAASCVAKMENASRRLISAGTMTEALIVASGKKIMPSMNHLLTSFSIEVVPVTEATANHAADAYRQWGKGFHSASLNFGDCFGYVLAKTQNCPLLFVGNDFAQTDVKAAIEN